MIKEFMGKYKSDLDRCKEDWKSVKTWYKQIPNLLTIARPLGMIPVNILFFSGNVIPAVVLTGLLLLTDFFDGKLARKWGVQSKFGADLDAVCDKVMFLGMSLPVMINYPVMIINFLLEGAIVSVNLLGRIKGLDTKTVFSGKVKTWFLFVTLGIGYLVQFLNVPASVLKYSVMFTSLTQCIALTNYVSEYKKMLKEKEMPDNSKDKEDDIIFELLDDKEQNKLLEQLSREREFVLSTLDPNKVYKGKKRVRQMMQEKKNNNYIG